MLRRDWIVGLAGLSVAAAVVIAQPGQRANPEEFVKRLLRADANGDGKLSRDELPTQFADRIFDGANTNGDEFLDADELKAFAESRTGGGRRGQPGQRPDGERGRRQGEGEQRVSFDRAMGQMARAMRTLNRSSFEGEMMDRDLESVAALQSGLLAAKADLGSVRKSDAARAEFADDEAAYARAFRIALMDSLAESLKLERAVLEGDADAASASIDRLMELQGAGHDLFQAENPW